MVDIQRGLAARSQKYNDTRTSVNAVTRAGQNRGPFFLLNLTGGIHMLLALGLAVIIAVDHFPLSRGGRIKTALRCPE